MHALGLADQILTVPFSSPAAKNRYILNGDRIHAMPSSISGLVKAMYSNHILKGSFMSFVKEPFVGKTAKADESIHEFISRRFSPELANRMISALVHGIYAGNVENLSVRSTFKQLWDWEQSHGSIIRGIFMSALCEKPRSLQEYIQPNAISFIESVRNNCSIYSFKDGLQTLTDGLYRELKSRSNVEILTETECIEINGVVDGVQSFSPPSQPSVR